MSGCPYCERLGDVCPRCERLAEGRADARRHGETEPLDRWGRDADWNWPRGYGGPVMKVTEPGVYAMPFDAYLADPVPGGSLSTSGAKTLLNACPAIFDYERKHGRPDKVTFDVGHAAHAEVLGDGMRIVVVEGEWRTKDAKARVAAARESGAVPLHEEDYAHVQGMAETLRAHPIAGKLLHPDRGTPEQTLIWLDDTTGVWRRARLDALPHPAVGRMVIVDYKTTDCAKPAAFAKSVANYGYHMQGAAYIDAVTTLGLADDAAFLLVAQEKQPPYLISVIELSAPALRVGRERNQRALEIFRRCTETNHWPGYSEGIELVDLPLWAERAHESEMAAA